MSEKNKYPHVIRPLDFVVFGAVLFLAVLLFCMPLLAGEGETLTVRTPQGEHVYPLSVDRTITVTGNGYTLTVCIEGGAAYVQSTTCPEEICRRTGRISRPGETVLCTRSSVLLRISGEGGFDAVAG